MTDRIAESEAREYGYSESDDDAMYKIVRFQFQSDSVVIDTGLTLAEAQEWCQREDTHGEGWFDGYQREDD